MVRKKIFIMICLLFFLVGCTSEPNVVEEPLVEEVEEEEEDESRVATTEDDKTIVLKRVNEWLLVFDVLEHHDQLQEKIESSMSGKPEGELKETVTQVVYEHMDLALFRHIEEELEKVNPSYAYEDVQWIFEKAQKKRLYDFIILYEYEFYLRKP